MQQIFNNFEASLDSEWIFSKITQHHRGRCCPHSSEKLLDISYEAGRLCHISPLIAAGCKLNGAL